MTRLRIGAALDRTRALGLCHLAFAALARPVPGLAATVPPSREVAIVLENRLCRYEIGANGQTRAFVNLADGKNYCQPGQPFMLVTRGGKTWPSTAVEQDGDLAVVTFGDSGVEVRARLETKPDYFTLTVERVAGPEIDSLQLCNLSLTITQNVGTLVNAAWNESFGACVLACNDRTEGYGADAARGVLCARCYPEYGLQGARVAILGTPTAGPDPADRLLDAIGRVEVAEGLPHPKIHGVWIKQAKERFESYLMVHDLGEANVDEVIRFARGGFGCVEFYPWASTPTYGLNPKLFPHDLAGLKKVCAKIHAAGLEVGLHCMQGMVGWGAKDDPYLVPRADPRLLQSHHATLAAALGEKATEVSIAAGSDADAGAEATAGWPDRGDLYVEGEIIHYGRRTAGGFAECKRGLWGTRAAEHPAGARVGLLVNCFPIWGGTVYCPDVKTDMVDEICATLAHYFNETGADMSYFDGGEELAAQPPAWRNQGLVALGVMRRLRKPVVLEGNALYTHLSWHVITRGSPSFDPIYFGRREYTLRAKGQNPARWARNLLTGDVGWFAPHTHSLTTDAVTPDEVMLLCLKAVGGRAPISFLASAANLWANRRMPEMLDIIRACDELKRTGYFTEAARRELAQPMAEHTLEQTPDGGWELRPRKFGPAQVVLASDPERGDWIYANPYVAQRPWVRIRARARLSPYGSADNIVLADPARCLTDPAKTPAGAEGAVAGVPFRLDGTGSPDLVQSVAPSDEEAPDGSAAFRYTAENRGKSASSWCRVTLKYPQPLDLTTHRRLGLWVKANGCGGILNVELAGTDARRHHYIPLDFTGWRYVELVAPDDGRRFWDYSWPFSWTDLFYTCQPIYKATREVNLYYNGLPAGAKADCLIGRIEALAEHPAPLRDPTLVAGGRRMVFPVSLEPDEYLELDWAGRCGHFGPDGGLLGEVRPEGSLRLAKGDNWVRFTCAGSAGTGAGDAADASSDRAQVTLSVRGKPLADVRRPGARAGGRYPSLEAAGAQAEELRVLPGPRGTTRVMLGPYELAGGPSAFTVPAFDGTSNTWTVVNDTGRRQRAAVLVSVGAGAGASYSDPRALLVEDFDELSSYSMSHRNEFEKYVRGGGKILAPCGPVREGVTQTFDTCPDGPRAGEECGAYCAINKGAAGGWCAKGRRFLPPIDLSSYAEVAFWLHGDGLGETLRFQFRDTHGRSADWITKIDFAGWRLQRCRLDDAPDFDWHHTEYMIFYFNDLPAGETCEMRLDRVKALPPGGAATRLRGATLVVNGERLALPATLRAGQALALSPDGKAALWEEGNRLSRPVAVEGAPVILQPGPNRLRLDCARPESAPDEVTVRLYYLGAL